jgi:hypothetical protein
MISAGGAAGRLGDLKDEMTSGRSAEDRLTEQLLMAQQEAQKAWAEVEASRQRLGQLEEKLQEGQMQWARQEDLFRELRDKYEAGKERLAEREVAFRNLREECEEGKERLAEQEEAFRNLRKECEEGKERLAEQGEVFRELRKELRAAREELDVSRRLLRQIAGRGGSGLEGASGYGEKGAGASERIAREGDFKTEADMVGPRERGAQEEGEQEGRSGRPEVDADVGSDVSDNWKEGGRPREAESEGNAGDDVIVDGGAAAHADVEQQEGRPREAESEGDAKNDVIMDRETMLALARAEDDTQDDVIMDRETMLALARAAARADMEREREAMLRGVAEERARMLAELEEARAQRQEKMASGGAVETASRGGERDGMPADVGDVTSKRQEETGLGGVVTAERGEGAVISGEVDERGWVLADVGEKTAERKEESFGRGALEREKGGGERQRMLAEVANLRAESEIEAEGGRFLGGPMEGGGSAGGSAISTEGLRESLEIAGQENLKGTEGRDLAAVSKDEDEGTESSSERNLVEKQLSGAAYLNGVFIAQEPSSEETSRSSFLGGSEHEPLTNVEALEQEPSAGELSTKEVSQAPLLRGSKDESVSDVEALERETERLLRSIEQVSRRTESGALNEPEQPAMGTPSAFCPLSAQPPGAATVPAKVSHPADPPNGSLASVSSFRTEETGEERGKGPVDLTAERGGAVSKEVETQRQLSESDLNTDGRKGMVEPEERGEVQKGVELGRRASGSSAGDSIGDVIAILVGESVLSNVAASGGRQERSEVPQPRDRRAFQMAESPPGRMLGSGTAKGSQGRASRDLLSFVLRQEAVQGRNSRAPQSQEVSGKEVERPQGLRRGSADPGPSLYLSKASEIGNPASARCVRGSG